MPPVMIIVLDTISLVKFCIIEIGTLKVIEWMRKDFKIITSPKAYQDGRRHITRSDNQEAEMIYHRMKDIQHADLSPCLDYVTECLSEMKEGDKVDEGEKTALALAVRTALSEKEYVLFITDDYKALNPIKKVLSIHGVGVAKSGFYILRQIGMLNSSEIAIEDVDVALRSLQNELRDNGKPGALQQKPDRLYADNAKMLDRLRGKAATRSQCRK